MAPDEIGALGPLLAPSVGHTFVPGPKPASLLCRGAAPDPCHVWACGGEAFGSDETPGAHRPRRADILAAAREPIDLGMVSAGRVGVPGGWIDKLRELGHQIGEVASGSRRPVGHCDRVVGGCLRRAWPWAVGFYSSRWPLTWGGTRPRTTHRRQSDARSVAVRVGGR
jgi:hypothetical protein